MEKEELEKLFCLKIRLEIERYKQKILSGEPEEIYQRSYQTNCYLSIYEILVEMSREMEENTLKWLLVFPGLVAYLYSGWLKKKDSFQEELQDSLKEDIYNIEERYLEDDKEEGKAA